MIREGDPHIVGEQAPSGTFFRASRVEDGGNTIVLGPSAGSPADAVTELNRDAGGPTTFARPRLPGEPSFRQTQPAAAPPSSIESLDRDSASERARGRARRRLPGVLAMIALLMGCAHATPQEGIAESRARIEQARQAVEALAVVVATARSVCDSLGAREPEQCQLLDDVPIDRARDTLRDADAAAQTAETVVRSLAPYADAAQAVLSGAP